MDRQAKEELLTKLNEFIAQSEENPIDVDAVAEDLIYELRDILTDDLAEE